MVNKVLQVREGKREEGLPKERQRPSSMCSSFPVSMSQNLHNHLVKSFIVLMTNKRGSPSLMLPVATGVRLKPTYKSQAPLPAMRALSPVLLSRALLGGAALIPSPGE